MVEFKSVRMIFNFVLRMTIIKALRNESLESRLFYGVIVCLLSVDHIRPLQQPFNVTP